MRSSFKSPFAHRLPPSSDQNPPPSSLQTGGLSHLAQVRGLSAFGSLGLWGWAGPNGHPRVVLCTSAAEWRARRANRRPLRGAIETRSGSCLVHGSCPFLGAHVGELVLCLEKLKFTSKVTCAWCQHQIHIQNHAWTRFRFAQRLH